MAVIIPSNSRIATSALSSSNIPQIIRDQTVSRAESLLSKSKGSLFSADFKEFILLNNASSIRDSRHEGGQPASTLAMWRQLLAQCKDFGLFEEQWEGVDEVVLGLEEFLSNKDKAHAMIVDALKEKGQCYVPAGWMGKKCGHYCGLKFWQLDDSRIAVAVLNEGGGAERHDIVEEGEHKMRFDYMSRPLAIENSIFEGSGGKSLIDRLFAMCDFSYINFDVLQLEADDLYMMLAAVGEYLPQEPIATSKMRAVTGQRSGSCPSSNNRVILRDYLQGKGVDAKGIRRFRYMTKLTSLIDVYSRIDSLSEENRFFYQDAILEHFTRLDKLYPTDLSEEEFLLGKALGDKVQERLDATKKEVEPMLLPERRGEDVTTIGGENFATAALSLNMTATRVRVIDSLAKVSSSTIAKSLNGEDFWTCCDHLLSLPLPSGEKSDSYWDNVAQNDIAKVIESLEKYVKKIHEQKSISGHAIAASLRAYDIAAQLAPRLFGEKFSGYYLTVHRPDFEKLRIFTNKSDYDYVWQSLANFDKRKQQGGQPIFETAYMLDGRPQPTGTFLLSLLSKEQRETFVNEYYKGNDPGDEKLEESFCIGGFPSSLALAGLFQLHRLSWRVHNLEDGQGSLKRVDSPFVDEGIGAHTAYRRSEQVYDFFEGKMGFIKRRALPEPRSFNYSTSPYQEWKENAIFHPTKDAKRTYEKEIEAPWLIHENGSRRWDMFENETMPKEWHEDLCVIESKKHMQVQEALQWVMSYPEALTHPLVRKRIEGFLFQYGALARGWNDSKSDLADLISEFLHGTFARYRHHGDTEQVTLWLLRMTASLQTYEMIEEVNWPDLETLFAKALASENGIYRQSIASALFDYFHSQRHLFLTLSRAKLLYKAFAISNLEVGQEGNEIKERVLGQYRDEMVNVLDSQTKAERVAFCNDVTALIFGAAFNEYECQDDLFFSVTEIVKSWCGYSSQPNGDWDDFKETIGGYAFRIDLLNGLVFCDGKRRISMEKAIQECMQKEKALSQFKKPPAVAFERDGATTLDGRYRFTRAGYDLLDIHQKIELNGKREWFTLVKNYSSDANFVLPHWMTGDRFSCWWDSTGNRALLVPHLGDKTYCYSPRMGLCVASSDNGRFQTSGQKVVEAPLWEEALSARIGKIELEGENEQLQELRLTDFDLAFEEREGALFCKQYPSYSLAEDQALPELEGHRHYLLLEGRGDERLVILPAYKTNKKTSPLPSDHSFSQTTLGKEGNYYTYTINATGDLESKDPDSLLYLAMVYKQLGQKERAKKALEASFSKDNSSKLAWMVAENWLEEKDWSASGVALDCLLLYRMAVHTGKWSRQEAGRVPADSEFKDEVKERLSAYRTHMSDRKEGACLLEGELRLTDSQLELITRAFGVTIGSRSSKQDIEDPFKIYDLPRSPSWKAVNGLLSRTNQPFVRKALPGRVLRAQFVEYVHAALLDDKGEHVKLRLDMVAFLRSSSEFYNQDKVLVAIILYALDNPRSCRYLKDESRGQVIFEALAPKVEQWHKFPSYLWQRRPLIAAKPERILPFSLEKRKARREKELPAGSNIAPPNWNITVDDDFKVPLRSLVDTFFNKTQERVAKTENSPLEFREDQSPLEKKIIEEKQKGHQINLQTSRPVYSKRDSDENLLTIALDSKIHADSKVANDLLQTIETMLQGTNLTVDQAKHLALLQARQTGKRYQRLTMDDLIAAFLTKDCSVLSSQNPYIEKDLQQLFSDCAEYQQIQTRIFQAKEARALLTSDSLTPFAEQRLGEILARKRAYDPNVYPEFLIYEYMTGLMLRPDQVKLLMWIVDNLESDDKLNHLLCQFAAGGGKTRVLIPLLAYRISSRGRLPVIMNTSALYGVAAEDIPESMRSSFGQHVEVIEAELDERWTIDKFEDILRRIEQYRKEKKTLLIKAETWHSINIDKKVALEEGDTDRHKAAKAVLDYFKEHATLLNDEAHESLSSLQESIKTFGEMNALPVNVRKLFVECYNVLFEEFDDKAKLANNMHAQLSSSQVEEVKVALANKMVQILPRSDTGVLDYLLSKDKKRPDFLIEMNRNEANQIVLMRAFIQTYLPHALKLRGGIDYGDSINDGDSTAAPRHDKRATKAHFGDDLVTLAITIQHLRQTGLDHKRVSALVRSLKTEHEDELKLQKVLAQTRAEEELSIWAKETISMDSVNPDTIGSMERLVLKIGKNPNAINAYLFSVALPQIKTPKYRCTSTPAELVKGFSKSIHFSATPGLHELYPVEISGEGCYLQLGFEAEVLETVAMLEKNTKVCTLSQVEDVGVLFREMREKYPDEMDRLSCIIDRGGILRNGSDEGVVRKALKNLDADYGITFAKKEGGREEMVAVPKDGSPSIPLRGSKLIPALKEKGLSHEDITLFLLFSIEKTTGTDLTQGEEARGALTVGPKQSVTETIQAAMRERLLLWKDGQSLFWLIAEELGAQIVPDKEKPSPQEILMWMVGNEAASLKKAIVSRAFQGVRSIVDEACWRTIEKASSLSAEYKKRKGGIRDEQTFSPWEMLELDSIDVDAELVLSRYAKSHYKSLGFRDDNLSALSAHEKELLDRIYAETKMLLTFLPSPSTGALNREVFQEKEVDKDKDQEKEIEFMRHEYVHFKREVYTSSHALSDSAFYNNGSHLGFNEVFPAFKKKTPSLIFSETGLDVIERSAGELAYGHEIKPIRDFLVKIIPGPQKRYAFVAVTSLGSKFYRDELLKEQKDKWLLVGMHGDVIMSGKCSILITKQDKEELKSSEELKEALAFAKLLSGQIPDPLAVAQIAKRYSWNEDDFDALVEIVQSNSVSARAFDERPATKVRELLGWRSLQGRNIEVVQDVPEVHIESREFSLSARVGRVMFGLVRLVCKVAFVIFKILQAIVLLPLYLYVKSFFVIINFIESAKGVDTAVHALDAQSWLLHPFEKELPALFSRG